MNGGRGRNAVRQLAIASVCLPLSVFPLGLVAGFLDSIGAWKYVPGRAAVIDVFFVTCVLPPIAGVICGRAAFKRIAARLELAGNYKYLATVGMAIGYILVTI